MGTISSVHAWDHKKPLSEDPNVPRNIVYMAGAFSGADGSVHTIYTNVQIGLLSGSIAALASTPAELCLVRMASDNRLPPAERRKYKCVSNAMYRIIKEEGFFTLWRGATLNIAKSCTCTCTQMAAYWQARWWLHDDIHVEETLNMYLLAQSLAAITVCVTATPIELIKVRVQHIKRKDNLPEHYAGWLTFKNLIKNEGVLGLWQGFVPFTLKSIPHSMISFVLLEYLLTMYRDHYMHNL